MGTDDVLISRKRMEEVIARHMKIAWVESKRWPNHRNLDVKVEWKLEDDGAVNTDTKMTPLP